MLFLISPAKSLDYDTPTPPDIAALATPPLYTRRAAELIKLLKKKSPADIAELMTLSAPLADLNVARYASWSAQTPSARCKPAVLAFDGDVYSGLNASTLTTPDLVWAQNHLLILSGLYGVLRPLDQLQPYRLEMGTRLATPKGANLYAFWGDLLAQHVNQQAAALGAQCIVNLASEEYFKSVARPGALTFPVVNCVFEDWKTDRYKIISFFAKKARGLMARWALQNRIAVAADLRQFNAAGYQFSAEASTPRSFVFQRAAFS
jgi:uncharacterized protein